MEQNDNVIIMEIETNYPDFSSFLKDSKDSIYRKILSIYFDMYKTKTPVKKFVLLAKVEGGVFDTNFDFNLSDLKRLKDALLPYFIKVEDYESCIEIKKILDSCIC